MKVLSLFDGMSCGQIALERAGIKVDTYYASEIDKYAIQVTQANYPNTVQLGSITEWKTWNIKKPDLIMGGSPCQGFSFAGKQLNFEDDRSKLFFTFVDILKQYKPKYFLLENVKMKKEYQQVITDMLGVEPIEINSALVSAQNRKRLYWTNIPGIEQLEDKKIFLKDIVLNDALSVCGVGDAPSFVTKKIGFSEKSQTILSTLYKENEKSMVKRKKYGLLSLILSEQALDYMNRQTADGRTHWDFKHHSDINDDKSAAVVANFFKGVPYNVLKDLDCIRKFHPVECERLQTVPEKYTEGVSNTQRYKMIGNGWTVDVIAHIFENIKK